MMRVFFSAAFSCMALVAPAQNRGKDSTKATIDSLHRLKANWCNCTLKPDPAMKDKTPYPFAKDSLQDSLNRNKKIPLP
jgi:hypothetical protein